MNKLSYFTTIICTLCLFGIPGSGLAKMTEMTNTELEQTTAQAGFSDVLDVLEINHDEETGSYYFGSKEDGYISVADISYDGKQSLTTDLPTTPFTAENGSTGVECNFDGNIVDISNFSSTIKIGSEIGAGTSFGNVEIGHMTLSLHVAVRITAE